MEFCKKASGYEFENMLIEYMKEHSPNIVLYYVFIDDDEKTFLHMYGKIKAAEFSSKYVKSSRILMSSYSGKDFYDKKIKKLLENGYTDISI